MFIVAVKRSVIITDVAVKRKDFCVIVDAIHLVPAVRICNFSRVSFSLNNISVIQ